MKKLFKKSAITTMVLVMLFMLGTGMNISAFESTKDYSQLSSPTPLAPTLSAQQKALQKALIGEPVIEPLVALAANIIVNITSPGDEEWRAKYPSSWMREINQTIERADDILGARYNINYVCVAQKVWDSNDSTTLLGDLLYEARDEWGLTNGADMMIAFTGQAFSYAGMSIVGQPYCIVMNQDRASNTAITQHETGHCYGLNHCTNSCVMRSSPYGYLDSICTSHNTQWSNARNKY